MSGKGPRPHPQKERRTAKAEESDHTSFDNIRGSLDKSLLACQGIYDPTQSDNDRQDTTKKVASISKLPPELGQETHLRETLLQPGQVTLHCGHMVRNVLRFVAAQVLDMQRDWAAERTCFQ